MNIKPFNISIASEAFAAGLFARYGYKVSVQYGANQPEYDLLVEKEDTFFKVSVKGSQTGSWGLIHSYMKDGRSYHEAAEKWASTHGKKTIICLVQFKGVDIQSMPRVYLALPSDIAKQLKNSKKNGDSKLFEFHTYKAGNTVELPSDWKLSKERIEQLLVLTKQ